MTITTAVIYSVPALAVSDDIAVRVRFCPGDPLQLTEVDIEPDPADDTALLQSIDQAITRLIDFAAAYGEAMAEDGAPTRLPMPWSGGAC